MKKSFKITAIVTFILACCLSLVAAISVSNVKVRAETPETTSVFEMEYGASVKLSGNGLRFKAKMSQDYYDLLVTNDPNDDVLLYGYIAPIEVLDSMPEYSDFIDGGKRVGGELDQNKIYQGEDGYYYANIVMTNLATYKYQDVSFSAIIFIEDNRGSSPTYIYPTLALDEDGHINIEAQNRTQYDVVNAAFLDGEESYESKLIDTYGSWYGTEEYPIFINTQAEYDAFASKLGDAVFKGKVEGKNVFVKEGLGDITSVVSVKKVSGHTVRFWDGNKLLDTCYVADGALVAKPKDPIRDGYEVSHWVCNGQRWDFAFLTVEEDLDISVQWKVAKSTRNDIGDLIVYGVTRADGTEIKTDSDVLGQKVVLASGSLADGAYYPGETNGNPDPTDETNSADQAYLAYDGQYGFNDYFVADFTGKNMPTMAFFANNYNESIFYGDGTKDGVIVATGLTWPNGLLFTEPNAYCTSVFNGKGLCMWGPHMIYSTAKNDNSKGVLLHSNVENVAIGRENLVSGKHYRVIMGFQPGDDPSNRAIKLVYVLYDLDNDCIVESREENTYNFFTDGWANAGQTRDQFCLGSIVAYGYFATPTVLDKTYAIYEDTTIGEISRGFGMKTQSNTTADGDSIVLGASSIGDGANYIVGQNNGGYVNQSYYALNGDYNLDDYVAFDFTGKNMPEIAFFAKNYNNSMYAEGTSKQGIVVVTGITTWDGLLSSDVNNNGTQINYGFPYMIQNTGDGNFVSGAFANSALGRANLVDGKHYRVIMGFTGSGNAITLNWRLYDLDTDAVVEKSSMSSWGFFTGSNAQVGNMTINDLSGSIVLYGKFGVTCTIDKLHGVYEDTTIDGVCGKLGMITGTFQNWDGTVLQHSQYEFGETPVYNGETPYRRGDAVFSSYEFVGWDKELTALTDDVTYTAVFTGTARENVTFSGDAAHTYGVEQSNNKIVLKASGIGDGANYALGQNNGGYVHQSYLALDGNYKLNSYVAFDFTGKNLPEIAFFAKNYNDSMYAEGTSKQGIVVVTGITTWDGKLESGVNGDGTQINYGYPYMIQNTSDGGFVRDSFANSALGRANLVDGTHYRVIMGFTGSGNAITLNWYLYNLDTNTVVEQSSMKTWNFFTGSNADVGNMKINDLSGSIVLYGKFGVACTLDKVYGVFENTDIATVASGLNNGTTYTVRFEDSDGNVWQEERLAYGVMPEYKGETPVKASDRLFDYTFVGWDKSIVSVTGNVTYTAVFETSDKDGVTSYNTTLNGESIVLGKGSIGGEGASIETGAGNGHVDQAYLALDGNYALNDYVAFDFTGKNMPEIAFFANNYDNSMYAGNNAIGNQKTGIVVYTGITTWDGDISWVNSNSTKINYGFPYMIQNTGEGGFCQGAFAESALGRANLVDGTHYRVIMGFTGSGNTITLNWYLYNLDTKEVVEQSSMKTWNFFTGSNADVGNMTINDLSGSIVLYGKFGTTCTIDNLYDVFEDTTLAGVIESIITTEEEGGEGEPSEPTSNAPDYSKYTDQFDFYAYSCYSDGTYEIAGEKYYIGKNLANLKQYAMYGDVGMTIYFPQNDMLINGTAESIAKAKALIDDLAKVGIHKTILQDNRILNLSMSETAIVGNGCQFADNAALDDYIYNCVKDYATYPGVYGVQLGDEPKYACLSAYAAVYNSLKRVNAKYGFNLFIQYNLNPLNVTQDVYDNYYPATSGTYEWEHLYYRLKVRDRFTDCVTRYTQYINDFLDAMQPDSIMYDDYPIREDKDGNKIILDSYIPCLQIVAKAAADRGIKFYHITQAFDNISNGSECRREVTEAGAKWLNNILMGFGAKQLAYYTYYTRSESDSTGGESFADGASFVDYNGNPTPLYGWMKEILANNQKFAPTVLQFDYKGSRTYGSAAHLAEVTVSDSFAKLSNCSVNTGAALVTELYDDENKNYMYMAMNVLDPDVNVTEETVTMTFNGYTNVLVYDGNGNFTTAPLTNGVYTATLSNGEAVYVIPYN